MSLGWLLQCVWVKTECSLAKVKGLKLALSLFFVWEPSLNATRDSHNGAVWRNHCITIIKFQII